MVRVVTTISVTGISSRRHPVPDQQSAACGVRTGVRHAGFTLIELMVVLLLIGIISSFAVLSIKRDPWDVELQRELQRLTALVSAGSESAVLRSQELAIRFDEDRYTFMTLGDKDWEPITDDRLFRERELPAGISLQLTIEDRELQLVGTDQPGRPDQNRRQPMVLL